MSWVSIQSPEKIRASQVRLSLYKKAKGGGGNLCLSLPSTLAGQLGMDKLETVDLQLGQDENAGKLRIPLDGGGAFKLIRLKHAVTIRFPIPTGVVAIDAADDVEYERGSGGIVVTLPEWARPGYVPPPKPPQPANVSRIKPGSLELQSRDLIMGAARVKLTMNEATVMGLLVTEFGNWVLTKQIVTAFGDDMVPNLVEVTISKLMGIIKQRELPLAIVSKPGVGYALRRAKEE